MNQENDNNEKSLTLRESDAQLLRLALICFLRPGIADNEINIKQASNLATRIIEQINDSDRGEGSITLNENEANFADLFLRPYANPSYGYSSPHPHDEDATRVVEILQKQLREIDKEKEDSSPTP